MAESIGRQLEDVVQNILDKLMPEKFRKRLLKPLLPVKGSKPITPSRMKKVTKRKILPKDFDPYSLKGGQTITNHQNELLELYGALEGVEQEVHCFR